MAKANQKRIFFPWRWRPLFWWVVGATTLTLGIGFGAFMLADFGPLFASLGAMGAVLAFILGLSNLRQWAMRASHTISKRVGLQLMLTSLFVCTLLLWLFPGRAKILSLNCGDLGCKAPDIVLRFAFDEWTGEGQALGIDAGVSIEILRDALFQKLSCVDGFRGVELYNETILDKLDLLIHGNLRLVNNIELSAQLIVIDPKTRQRLHSVSESQSLNEQTKFELTLLTLQNNLFQEILETINFEIQPENAAFVNHIPTDDPEALRLNNQAVELILHNQLDQAEAQLKDAVARDDRYADAYNNLGRIYRQRGDWPSTIAAYEDAVRSLSCVPLYHYNLGFAYEENNEYDAAIAAYKAALARNPAYVKALNNLGFVYLQTDKLVEAEQYLQQGLVITPTASYLHKNLGRVYLAQDRPAAAIGALEQAVALYADYAEARYFLAEAYQQAGQTQNACDQLAAYAPLAVADALDDPARVQAATTLSTTLTCSTRGATP